MLAMTTTAYITLWLNLVFAVLALCALQRQRVLVSFKQSKYTVNESAGRVAITIKAARRYYTSFDIKIRASVNKNLRLYASSYDFEESIQTIRFSTGQSTATVYIKIKDDNRVEPTEVFQVDILISRDTFLQQIVGFGDPSKAKVFIKDDDKPATHPPTKTPTTHPPTTRPSTKPPTTEAPTEPQMSVRIGFEFGRYKVKESCTLLSVTLVVKGEVLRPFTVNVFPVNFYVPSARAGRDFIPDVLRVNFQPGQSRSSICIVITDDDIKEGREKFRLLLSIPYSVRALGVSVQYPYIADVLITDDSDDGMGLPVQLPSTDDERSTMCICKPRPTASATSATPSPTLIPSPSPTLFPIPSPSPTLFPSSFSSASPTLIPDPSPTLFPSSFSSPSPTLFPSSFSSSSPTLIPSPSPTHPTLNIIVMFNTHSYSGAEADGVIAVTLVATGVSSIPYNVTITPLELITLSAREVFDYSNDTIVVTFNPGETNKTVLIVVNRDCIREGPEFFNLILSLDPTAMDLGVTIGDPSVAVAEIEDTDVIYVNFSQVTYSAEEADGMMIITVEADSFSIQPYIVEINPIEILPVGGPGNAEGNGTDFVSDTLTALFNPGDSQVNVSLPIIMDQIFEPTERLSLTLTVPDGFSDLNGKLLVKSGLNHIAEGEIIDSNVLVNFSADSYRANANAHSVGVKVTAFGSFDTTFFVKVIPHYTQKVNTFFDPRVRKAWFFTNINLSKTLVSITLFPEQVRNMDLQFIIRLVVPAAAMSQGVVLGEPNVATVTVPGSVPATRP